MEGQTKKVDYKKASAYYLVGTLFNKGISFITVPIYTRILSTSDNGIVNTYGSWASILSLVMGAAIYMGIRMAFIDYPDKIHDFMSVCTTFTLSSGLLIMAVVGVGVNFFNVNLSPILILLCLMESLGGALRENYSMYLEMQFKYRARTVLLTLPNLISTCLAIFCIMKICRTDLYMGKIVPYALVTVAVGMITTILIYSRSRVLYNKQYLKYALGISGPLVFHGIALSVLSQSDRIMITSLQSPSYTGIYSMIYNVSMIAAVLTSAFDGVWAPWFLTNMKEQREENINDKGSYYLRFMTILMIGVIFVAPEVVKLLTTEAYWVGIPLIPPLVLSNFVIFAYTFYVSVEHYYKKTAFITINTVIAAAANIFLNYIFIPKFGYVAAAYTTLVSYLLSFVLHALRARCLNKKVFPVGMFVVPLIEVLVAVFVFNAAINLWYVRWFLALMIVAYSTYKNYDFIREKLLKS